MNAARARLAASRRLYARRRLKAIAARWNARAATWDRSLQDPACHLNEDGAYERFVRLALRLIARRKRFCTAHGVIDAGCGTGLVLARVIASFAWGVGVDISPKMIRAARAKKLPGAKFIVGDCFRLPSLCPKAGVVLSRGVLLSHYGRRQGVAILRAARASLAPGGFIVFDFLNETARTSHLHAPENKTWFTGAEVRTLARCAGFSSATIVGAPRRRVRILTARA